MTTPPQKPPGPLAFRLDAFFYERLEERAKRHELTPSREAQRMVMDLLVLPEKEEAERERLEREIHALKNDVALLRQLLKTLRGDLVSTAVALLSKDEPATEEEVRAWVSRTFRPTDSR